MSNLGNAGQYCTSAAVPRGREPGFFQCTFTGNVPEPIYFRDQFYSALTRDMCKAFVFPLPLSESQETGKIEKQKSETIYETCIEWQITDFFSVVDDNHQWKSPVISFAGTGWCLIVYPNTKSDFFTLFVQKNQPVDYSVEYVLGLKNRHGAVEPLFKGTLLESQTCSKSFDSIKLLRIRQRKSELALKEELTVTCKLKCKNVLKDALDEPRPKKLIKLDTLSENFKDLYTNKESCDVTLLVKDKEYKAHKAVLIARSPVFAATFPHEMLEKQKGVVNIPDCDAESFKEFLEFLYCGKLEEELSCCSAFHLYETSNKYNIQELRTFCMEFLMQNLTPENFCNVVLMANMYDDAILYSASQKFFNKNLSEIFETSDWESFLKTNNRLANKLLKEMSKVKNTK